MCVCLCVSVLDASNLRLGGGSKSQHVTVRDASEVIMGGNMTAWKQTECNRASVIQINGGLQTKALRIASKSSVRSGLAVQIPEIAIVEGHSVLEVWQGGLNVGGHLSVEQTSSVVVMKNTLYTRGDLIVRTSMVLIGKSLHTLGKVLGSASSEIQVGESVLTGLDGRQMPLVKIDLPDPLGVTRSNGTLASAEDLGVKGTTLNSQEIRLDSQPDEPTESDQDVSRRLQIDIRMFPKENDDDTAFERPPMEAVDPQTIQRINMGLPAVDTPAIDESMYTVRQSAQVNRATLVGSQFALLSGFKEEVESLLPKTRDEAMQEYFKESLQWGRVLPTYGSSSQLPGMGGNATSLREQIANNRGVILDMSSVMTVQGNLTARDLVAVNDGSALSVRGGCGLYRGRMIIEGRSSLNVTDVLEVVGLNEATLSVLQRYCRPSHCGYPRQGSMYFGATHSCPGGNSHASICPKTCNSYDSL